MSEMLDGAIRRVVVIGNGFAGAENQSIGLVRALGLSNRISLYVSLCFLLLLPFCSQIIAFQLNLIFCDFVSLQRVTRPQGGINRWFKWLPVSIHKKLDSVIRKFCGNSRFLSLNHNVGISGILEADAHSIAKMARQTFYKYVMFVIFFVMINRIFL